jgi:hypothetical protein|tara:strand:+ start:239 stop:469 length:231 start_codon:yes stop_codon:yes gene_type:complete
MGSRTLEEKLKEAEHKAWDALGRYKFNNFGYWCAIWVHLNQMDDTRRANPWSALTKIAKNSPKARIAKQNYTKGRN